MAESSPSRESREEFELDLSRVGMIIMFPVGCWAFYTTFMGLADITRQGPDDWVGLIGAVIGSSAIVIMLALTSWLLGADLAAAFANQRRPDGSTKRNLLLLTITFLFFLSLSVFFSYTYYHANFFSLSSKRLTGEQQPMEMAATIIPRLNATITTNYDEMSKAILASDGGREWATSVGELLRVAGTGGDSFTAKLRENEEKRRIAAQQQAQKDAQIIANAEKAKTELDTTEKRLASHRRDIETYDKLIVPEEAVIDQLKAKAAQHDADAEKSKRGLDKSGKDGCGPICKAAQEEARKVRTDIAKREAALEDVRGKRKTARNDAVKLQERVPILEQQIRQAVPLGATPVPPQGSTTSSGNVSSDLAALEAAEARFRREPSWLLLRQAKPVCDSVLGTVRQLTLSTTIRPEFDCLPLDTATKSLLDASEAVLAGRGPYNRQCALDGRMRMEMDTISGRVRNKEIAPADALVAAKKLVDDCIAKAGAAGVPVDQLQAFYRESSDFVRGNTLDRNRFDLSMESMNRLDGDFRKAIAVALAQDLLIIVFKFVSDNYKYRSRRRRTVRIGVPVDVADRETEAPEIRAHKALLRLSRPGQGDTSRITEAELAALDPDVAVNLRGLLSSFARQGVAWGERKGAYVLDNSAISAIESALQESQDGFQRSGDGAAVNLDAAAQRYRMSAGNNPRMAPPPDAPKLGEAVRTQSGSPPRRLRLQDYLSPQQRQRVERTAPPPAEPAPAARVEEQAVRSAQLESGSSAFEVLRNRKQGV